MSKATAASTRQLEQSTIHSLAKRASRDKPDHPYVTGSGSLSCAGWIAMRRSSH